MSFWDSLESDLDSVFLNLGEFAVPALYYAGGRDSGGDSVEIAVLYRAGGEILDPDSETLMLSHEPRAIVKRSALGVLEPGPEDQIEITPHGAPSKVFWVAEWEDHRQGTVVLKLSEESP
jgi:hypothetical protein